MLILNFIFQSASISYTRIELSDYKARRLMCKYYLPTASPIVRLAKNIGDFKV